MEGGLGRGGGARYSEEMFNSRVFLRGGHDDDGRRSPITRRCDMTEPEQRFFKLCCGTRVAGKGVRVGKPNTLFSFRPVVVTATFYDSKADFTSHRP